ncbi:sterol desaturase family protein [Aquirufa rosea]|nr:sterol desaturase family protein [Aquirufa rosea]
MEILLWLGTFILMEALAWFTHKYIMHGWMWTWHQSHHVHHKNVLEKNDLFSVIFGILSTLTIILGAEIEEYRALLWIGLGIATYGLCYFVFHDVIVHRRIKIKFKAQNRYLKRLIKAHYVHHEVHEKEGAEAFGFLYAPKKYE